MSASKKLKLEEDKTTVSGFVQNVSPIRTSGRILGTSMQSFKPKEMSLTESPVSMFQNTQYLRMLVEHKPPLNCRMYN